MGFIIRPPTELSEDRSWEGLVMSMVLGTLKLSCLLGNVSDRHICLIKGETLARNQNPEIMNFWVDEMQSNEPVKEGCIE